MLLVDRLATMAKLCLVEQSSVAHLPLGCIIVQLPSALGWSVMMEGHFFFELVVVMQERGSTDIPTPHEPLGKGWTELVHANVVGVALRLH